MARIRSIKPEFWSDSKVVGLSPLARLLFVGSWTFADDHGALAADPVQLKLRVLPAEPCDAEALVDELLKAGLLVEMTNADGERFWVVRSWAKHQRVNRPSASAYGDPDEWSVVRSPSTFNEPSVSPHAGVEGKGGERKGDNTHATFSEASLNAPPVDNAAVDARFEVEFWPVYPARRGKKVGKAAALVEWRKLTDAQRDRAVIGARHLAAADDVLPKDPERFLRRGKGGAYPFDDWQEPAVRGPPSGRAPPRPASPDTDWHADWRQGRDDV